MHSTLAPHCCTLPPLWCRHLLELCFPRFSCVKALGDLKPLADYKASCRGTHKAAMSGADAAPCILPVVRSVPLPNPSVLPQPSLSLGRSDRTTPTATTATTPSRGRARAVSPEKPRDYANDTLLTGTVTRYTHARPQRPERCFLCSHVQSSPHPDADDTANLVENPEQGIVTRMRAYWEANVPHVELKTLAAECARLFRLQYENHFLPPQPDDEDEGGAAAAGAAPYSADADMIYQHFLVHECTAVTRRAVMKRAYCDTFEFMQSNKSNGFMEGHNGKRRPSAASEAAHAKNASMLLRYCAYLDRMESEAS